MIIYGLHKFISDVKYILSLCNVCVLGWIMHGGCNLEAQTGLCETSSFNISKKFDSYGNLR